MTTETTERPASLVRKEMKLARESMNDALKPRFARIEKKHIEADTNEVMARHSIGREIMEITGPDGDAKYGDNAVALVAAGLGIGTADLYAYQNIARAWSKEELDTMLATAREKNFMLGYTHLTKLCSLTEASERKMMTRRCISELMTVSELNAAIQAHRGIVGNNRTGKPIQDPKTPHAGILQLATMVDGISKREKNFVRGVFDKLEVLSPAEWDAKTVKDMEKAKASLEHTKATIARLDRKLADSIQKGHSALEARKRRKDANEKTEANKTHVTTPERLAAQRKKKKKVSAGEFTPISKSDKTGKKKKKKRALARA